MDESTTTTSAPPQTTTAPPTTTTAPPAPPPTTTAPPATTTTAAPAATTTAAAETTTAAPDTTTAPPAGTTAAPETANTAQVPTFASVAVQIVPDDGASQNPISVQVPVSATLTLVWSATNASAVNIDLLGDGLGVSGSQTIPAQDATYTLIAIGSDGSTQSDPYVIDVHTHDDGEVVSPHALVSSGVAQIVSFNATTKDGQPATAANLGDTITLTAVVSDAAESVTLNGETAEVTELNDGTKQASLEVQISAGMSGDFVCQAMQEGAVSDSNTVHVELPAAAAPSVELQVAAGDDTAGSSATSDFEKPLTLTWKVTGAASAHLSAAHNDAGTTFDGPTGDGGVLRLAVTLGSAMPARVTMLDGDSTLATWECDLAPPDSSEVAPNPDLSGASPQVAFGSLIDAPAELPVDVSGNGGGTISVDPGPHSSVTFTVTIAPIDGTAEQTAQVTVQVTNFLAELLMADGSAAPANSQCRLELGVMAGDTGAQDQTQQAA